MVERKTVTTCAKLHQSVSLLWKILSSFNGWAQNSPSMEDDTDRNSGKSSPHVFIILWWFKDISQKPTDIHHAMTALQ